MFPFTVIITISFLQQLDCTGPVLFYRGMKGNPCAVLITSLYVCLTNSTEGPYCTRYNYKSFQVPSQDKARFDIIFNVTVNKDLWLH